MTRDSNDTAVRWAKWKKNIERQFRFFGVEDPQLKKDGLIIYGGQEIADLDDSIPDPILEGEQNEYTRLIAKLDQHFLPKKNKDYARFKLGNLVQQDEEPMTTYYARIREIAQKCSYTDENDAIPDHLIKTMRNNVIRVKAIRHNWTLREILDESAIYEQAQLQAREIKQKLEATESSQRVKYTKQDSCQRCGRKHDKAKCSAYGEKCRNVANSTTLPLSVDRNQHGRFLMKTTKREEKTIGIDIVKTNQGERNIKTANLRDRMIAKVTENSLTENHKFDMLRELRKSQIPVPLTFPMTRTSSNTSESNKKLE